MSCRFFLRLFFNACYEEFCDTHTCPDILHVPREIGQDSASSCHARSWGVAQYLFTKLLAHYCAPNKPVSAPQKSTISDDELLGNGGMNSKQTIRFVYMHDLTSRTRGKKTYLCGGIVLKSLLLEFLIVCC